MNRRRPCAVVTGGNRGIGLEVCRELGRRGWTVFAGVQAKVATPVSVRALQLDGLDVRAIQLNVTRSGSPVAAARAVAAATGSLDALVNNAACFRPGTTLDLDEASLLEMFDVNVVGVVRTVQAFLPLLRGANLARIVNVTSATASMSLTASGSPLPGDRAARAAYVMSKTALNMYTLQLAEALRADPQSKCISVTAVSPGWTRTRMNSFTARRSPAEGAAVIVDAVTIPSAPNGRFLGHQGDVPW
jgi:NAD(P)-dependent dehydrogenase (short-subunit alcohol dehydrogenase family)